MMTEGRTVRTSSSSIWVEQRLAGFHHWPDAPASLDFLAHRHRHLFRVRADIAVRHHERDVEFFALAEHIRQWWGKGERECGAAACETLAHELGGQLLDEGLAVLVTAVAADDEGGATVDWRPMWPTQ